jgi:conjugal transfer ATP-binding protein TraC
MMPIIGEWTGTPPIQGQRNSKPVLTLFGRKGQSMAVDIFANPSGNYNGIVVGTSGSGKSFFLNELTFRMLATGGRVWIIDVGRSYEKLASMLGGQFIEFSDASNISLNPFSLIEDIDRDMEMLKPLMAQMISPSRPRLPR